MTSVDTDRSGRGRRSTRLVAVAAAAALAAGWIVATGPISSASPATHRSPVASKPKPWDPPAKKATGSPLYVATSAAVDYNGATYPNILATAKVAGDWINAHGGIKGHRLVVTTCDTRGTPTVTAQCGRQAIGEHAVADIGSFTLSGNAIVPELTKAHTSWFGICCPVSSDEFTYPNVQAIGNALSYIPASIVKMVEDGCKHIGVMEQATNAPLDTLENTMIDNALKSIGAPRSVIAKVVDAPITVTTMAPEIANVTTGTDCILADISEDNYQEFFPPFVQSGAHQRLYGAQGNFDILSTKAFPTATKTGVIGGVYTTIKTPAWKNFRAAIKTYHAPNLNYNSLAGLGTWAGYMAFQQIADGIKGPVDNVTFLAAAQKATVDMPGVPVADFANKFHGLGGNFLNDVNWDQTFDVVHDGVPVPWDHGKFFTMTDAVLGKPLPKADIPPGGEKG